MKNHIPICAAIVLFCSSYAFAGTWTALDKPGLLVSGTQAFGISGNRIVGTYLELGSQHGFIYDGSSWSALDAPGAKSTWIQDNFGNSAVGTYDTTSGQTYSFFYDGTNWTTLSKSGATGIRASGIYGNNIVGSYADSSSKQHGFIYDGSNWTTIDKSGATSTYLYGISGNDIVGAYFDSASQRHSFIYNQGSWTDIPNNPWTSDATVVDISGNYIVSTYGVFNPGGYGLLYDGSTWTKLQMPGAIETAVYGIDGDKVVGSYMLTGNKIHGFVYTIPEPATLLLLGFGAAFATKRKQNLKD
jgi:hypothetical protein